MTLGIGTLAGHLAGNQLSPSHVSPKRGTATPLARPIKMAVPTLPQITAMLVALLAGNATLYHCRMLLREGTELANGGGWAVLIMLEFTTTMAAVATTLNLT